MTKREILLASLGLLVGAVLLLFWLSPRVIDTNIDAGTSASWQSIRIRLSRPLDADSLKERFKISPELEGQLAVDGQEIIFSPSEAFAYDQEYTVSLRSGVRGQNALPLWRSSQWTFKTAEPRLVFLRQSGEVTNLWVREPDGQARQLTAESLGIWDYSILPRGQGILYSALAPDGTTDLVRWRPDESREIILDCLDSLCRAAQWQPGGRLVAFEKVDLDRQSEPAEVWLLDTATGRQERAHDPALLEQINGGSFSSNSPRWSADGRYLSYYQPDGRLIIVRDMAGGQATLIPSNLELMGGWSPLEHLLAYTELTFGVETLEEHEAGQHESHEAGTSLPLFSHLILADPFTEGVRDLSKGQESQDGLPAWHPDGSMLALGRSKTGAGRQIWLLPTTAGAPKLLTDDPLANYSAPSWSPDGDRLAFMRFEIGDAAGMPAIWWHDFESGEQQLVEEEAFLPGWLP